jgi:predicted nucleic acid-binding Zn ribbon protein
VPTDDEPSDEQHRDEQHRDEQHRDDSDARGEAGSDPSEATGEASIDQAGSDTADTAAASALARARQTARAKGLRPGRRVMRKNLSHPGHRQADPTGSGRDGRDPSLLGDQLERLLLDRGWKVDLAVGSVMGRWPAIVGTEVAEHCTPMTFSDGTLTVRADSTAWATQLRLMSSSILGRLETEVGKDAVTELRVQGPSAPSWTRGPRKSTGPGPRDTYG